MVVVDLDGTLRGRDGSIDDEDLRALREIGDEGYVRVIATGRSFFSFSERADGLTLPVDYLVFSTGLGVYRMSTGEVSIRGGLPADETDRIVSELLRRRIDFMVHAPVPENHHFLYRDAGTGSLDFARRVALYPDHSRPLDGPPGAASQLLVIAPESKARLIPELQEMLPHLNVVRTTSPLDHESLWIEIFPGGISKGSTVDWLAGSMGLLPMDVMAVGNDYNDVDLLEWAGAAFVVRNTPNELRRRFRVVSGEVPGEVASAIREWRS